MGQDGQNLPKLGGVSLNLGSDRWRYAFTAGCLTVGSVMVSVSLLFSRRCVRSVVLKRGGQQVTVVTHALVGGRSFSVPLSQVTCHAHRSEVAAHIPLRIKGHSLYYLLDRQGRLANPRLFDVTVGAYRTL
ncbi:TM223 protein, partial [Amia calva]|nr:TM223 protein [Amia calva]